MTDYTEPDMCLRCGSPTSLCQCPQSVLDWYEYAEILLAENEVIRAEFKETLACRHARIDALSTEGRRLRSALEELECDSDWCGKSPHGTPGKRGYDDGKCQICTARKALKQSENDPT